ncbi:HAD superfamily hydrolase (TIGR01509 family) [Gemmobacter caeni]|uniref:HAD superfamily hydrolase (TIGR01509 family) n=1 Tax=Gemmobacter caeni TaxID=589035 RepID=A0A2T6B4X1_9RHOB|nr:HAD-IA family hydrolase [Gemmobacter caeni]PTX51104.1 HAD superfamily hydrolase (TIGR01509 family) [Gemmobacter caeni]TWJ01104.1 HAD superfamily hydrolase (TIGR01509 family) [Gemmobacter caeni]
MSSGIADEFAAIVGGDDVANGKPNPDIFLLAAERLGMASDACIVIEDAISGVAAAKTGGFFCIGIDRSGQSQRLAGADLIVASLSELRPCEIEKLMKK